MSAYAQTLAEVFRECSDVRAGRTNNAYTEVKSSVEIVLYQLPIRLQCGEFVNTNTNRLSLNFFASASEFVQSSSRLFLGRIHRRNLIDFTTQASECSINLCLGPGTGRVLAHSLFSIRDWVTGTVARLSRVTEPNNCVVFLFDATEKLSKAGRAADKYDQHSRSKWIQRSGMANTTLMQYMTCLSDDIVRGQLGGLVDYQDSLHEYILDCRLLIGDCFGADEESSS